MDLKKTVAIVTALLLILTFSGCRKNPQSDSVSSGTAPTQDIKNSRSYITLLYSSADTFNPYTAKTDINRQLCRLLYEPLVKLDNSFSPVYSIAQSVETVGTKCTVTLKSVNFSDGSAVTANDVVYSFNLAKGSGSAYAGELYVASSATAEGNSRVIFSLTKADPYFINLLDFPIIKAGSEKITDSDSVLQPPVGCGRYKVNDSRDKLVINESFFGKKGSITEIQLINAPDTDSVTHYVEVGAADAYYSDISGSGVFRMSGKKKDINLNNLIYIGINQNYGTLAENSMRQALSSGIDRKKLCQKAYYNNALPATGFFNPVWEPAKAVQNIQIEAKSQITVENLEKIGYNSLDNNGKRKNAAGQRIKFSLLVNSENRMKAAAAQIIASQLAEYGIEINVVERKYADYLTLIREGNFQLFLGEIKLTDNMDISPMVTEGGSAAYGLKKPAKEENKEQKPQDNAVPEQIVTNKPAEVITGFYQGKNSVADVAAVMQSEMPFIPVMYRTGALFYNDNIENMGTASASDIYFSIEAYSVAEK